MIKKVLEREAQDQVSGKAEEDGATANKKVINVEVKVYSTINCPWCKKVKEYLSDKQVKFKEVDLTNDEVKQKEFIEKTGQVAVPVTEINGKYIIGFDKEVIDEMLKTKD